MAADLAKFLLRGYDERDMMIICRLCPPRSDGRVYGGQVTMARAIAWAEEHWQFLHETQVVARE